MKGSSKGSEEFVTEDYLIPSRETGVELHVRNRRLTSVTSFTPEKTVLYVHGARQCSEITFDLRLDGTSWMDYIARHGGDAWMMNVRGFGGSKKPPEMDLPPEANPPIAPYEVATQDVADAVDHVRRKRGVPRVNLIGYSHGSDLVALYATQSPEAVERLVLCAPFFLDIPPIPVESVPTFGAYHRWAVQDWGVYLHTGAPEEEVADLMPKEWFDIWVATALATDPFGAAQTPPYVRIPAGGLQDREVWRAGHMLFDPGKISCPTLVVRGEWDVAATIAYVRSIFDRLTNVRVRRIVEIGHGTHMIIVEKARTQLFREVQSFLDESLPDAGFVSRKA